MDLNLIETWLFKLRDQEKKPVLLTVGYRWKNPTTMDAPISHKEAIDIIENHRYPDFRFIERDDCFLLECFTAADMW